ncbi:MAG: YdiU family protein [Roseibium sp.]|nr:YdiU family protein [Roseibium sp.]
MTIPQPLFSFDNTYAREMDGFYVPWQGAAVPSPELVLLNEVLARDLGLDPAALKAADAARIFTGTESPAGAAPLAQVYAGHQFGGFSPRLGDGRALLIGEVIDQAGQRRDIQLKGSGPTPFSRGGDGKAVIGPVLREYVIGEAMHALGIPTTRALAAATTGETIYRDGPKSGAVLTRVASSHLRVGTFQYFAARGETDKVRQLADYAIERHDPDLASEADKYILLLRCVIDRQAALIAEWLLVGFVHGVMNTDNTAISGETIDYGPCAFLDAYDPEAVFSSIDHGGRYAFARQPVLAQWNLARFAECLVPLIDPDDADRAVERATEELNRFAETYQDRWLAGMRAKLGLTTALDGDLALAGGLLDIMQAQRADHTLVFRRLGEAARGNDDALLTLFQTPDTPADWLRQWRDRLAKENADPGTTAKRMATVNPAYIPRNHTVEDALSAAEHGDYGPVHALLAAVTKPFDERDELAPYAQPAPADFGPYMTFCGT